VDTRLADASTPNKRTVELQEAVKNVAASLGQTELKWTAHKVLVAAYNNEALPLNTRIEAAKHAIRFELPAKSESTITDNTRWHVSDGTVSMEEWKQKYSPQSQADDEEIAH
jgi:hypothetical protein